MRTQVRRFTLVMLFALVLVMVPSALAQDTTFGLSEEDYALWTTANGQSAEFETVNVAFTFDLNVTLGSSPVVGTINGTAAIDSQSGALQLDLTGEINQGGEVIPVNVGARVVENFLYYDLGDGNGWIQTTPDQLTSALTDGLGAGMTGMLPGGADMMATPGAMDSAGMDMMGSMMSGLGNINPNDFVAITSGDSDGLREFTIDLDVATLVEQSGLGGMLAGGLMGGMGGSTTQMSPEQTEQMSQMVNGMLQGLEFQIQQYVEPSSSLVERTVVDFNFPLAFGGSADAAIAFTLDIDVLNYNEPVSVTAPESFTAAEAAS